MCLSVWVFMCVGLSVCVKTSRSSWSLSLFLSFSSYLFVSVIIFSLHLFFSTLLLPCAAGSPRVWFPVVGPTVSPLPYLLKMLPFLVSRVNSRTQRRTLLPWSRKALIQLVTTCVLACPNLLTNLVNGA